MKVITSTMFSMKRGELRPYPKHANAFKSSTPRHRSVSCYCLNTGLYIWSISISHVHLIALWWPLIGIYGHAIAVSTYKYCSIIIAIVYYHYIIMLFFHIQYKVFFPYICEHTSYCKRPKRFNMWSIINFCLGVMGWGWDVP